MEAGFQELRFDLLAIYDKSISNPFLFVRLNSSAFQFFPPPSFVVSINPQRSDDRCLGNSVELPENGKAMFGTGDMVKQTDAKDQIYRFIPQINIESGSLKRFYAIGNVPTADAGVRP